MLKHPPRDSWPGFHGDYTGATSQSADGDQAEQCRDIDLAWAFQTQQNGGTLKSTPILVDGILYFTMPDHVWAATPAPATRYGITRLRRIRPFTLASVAYVC